MTNLYDEELRALQQQTARRQQLETRLTALRAQQPALERRVFELESEANKEQTDVDKLEGGSLAALFYWLIGQKGQKLDAERAEAYAARVRYDAEAARLAALEEDIRRCRDELQAVQDCRERYDALLAQKAARIKADGSEAAARLLELERQLGDCQARQKELTEAVDAGRRALDTADRLLRSLEDAGGLAVWDLAGGGLLADLAKHSTLDEAQQQLNCLHAQLGRLRTELADVTVRASVSVQIEGFDRFADYFFDGLLADWNAMDQIERSKEQAGRTRFEIQTVLKKLDGMLAAERQQQKALQARIDALVVGA